jgi:hypothetical protein
MQETHQPLQQNCANSTKHTAPGQPGLKDLYTHDVSALTRSAKAALEDPPTAAVRPMPADVGAVEPPEALLMGMFTTRAGSEAHFSQSQMLRRSGNTTAGHHQIQSG